WNTFLFLICVYKSWIIPFRIAFKTSASSITDWVFDAFFLGDMLLHYCYVAYTEDGELVTELSMIKRHYLRERLKMDFISTFPFDLLAYLILPRDSSWSIGVEELLRLLKLLRFGRYFGTVESIFTLLMDKGFLSGVILIAHFAACGFYAFARWKNSNAKCSNILPTECLWEGTWLKKQIVNGKLPIDGGVTWQQYIRSFNWALPTLVVVVIGDVVPTTNPETLYAFLWMIIGVTINAAIIGNVANIVSNLESEENDFNTKVDDLKNYMFKHHLSYQLHARVDDATRYLWSAHKGSVNEDDFILRLPYTLQADIIAQTRAKHIRDCQFFDFCSSDIVKALALCLRPLVFSSGDIVCHAGDMGQEMFFLSKGSVEVVSPDRTTCFATLVEGSFFG
ncbi:cation channel, partial [Thalassiosira pseudonana CCMP1335]